MEVTQEQITIYLQEAAILEANQPLLFVLLDEFTDQEKERITIAKIKKQKNPSNALNELLKSFINLDLLKCSYIKFEIMLNNLTTLKDIFFNRVQQFKQSRK